MERFIYNKSIASGEQKRAIGNDENFRTVLCAWIRNFFTFFASPQKYMYSTNGEEENVFGHNTAAHDNSMIRTNTKSG